MPPIGVVIRPMPAGQVRVLGVLIDSGGSLTRAKIADRLGVSGVYVGKSIGYSDPVKRAAFERTKDGAGTPESPMPTLLTRGYVSERTLDIDGVSEIAVSVTQLGIEFYLSLEHTVTEP